VIGQIPKSTALLDGAYDFLITYRTDAEGVTLAARLRIQYPKEMLIVLQHQYRDLEISPHSFSVSLWFSGVEERLTIPFSAVTTIESPRAGISLKR
jgi:uncharacterized protein